MTFNDKKQKLEYLLSLIHTGNAGKAEYLCSRIHVSKATFKRYLQDLRGQGYQIGYCTQLSTYYIIDPTKKKILHNSIKLS